MKLNSFVAPLALASSALAGDIGVNIVTGASFTPDAFTMSKTPFDTFNLDMNVTIPAGTYNDNDYFNISMYGVLTSLTSEQPLIKDVGGNAIGSCTFDSSGLKDPAVTTPSPDYTYLICTTSLSSFGNATEGYLQLSVNFIGGVRSEYIEFGSLFSPGYNPIYFESSNGDQFVSGVTLESDGDHSADPVSVIVNVDTDKEIEYVTPLVAFVAPADPCKGLTVTNATLFSQCSQCYLNGSMDIAQAFLSSSLNAFGYPVDVKEIYYNVVVDTTTDVEGLNNMTVHFGGLDTSDRLVFSSFASTYFYNLVTINYIFSAICEDNTEYIYGFNASAYPDDRIQTTSFELLEHVAAPPSSSASSSSSEFVSFSSLESLSSSSVSSDYSSSYWSSSSSSGVSSESFESSSSSGVSSESFESSSSTDSSSQLSEFSSTSSASSSASTSVPSSSSTPASVSSVPAPYLTTFTDAAGNTETALISQYLTTGSDGLVYTATSSISEGPVATSSTDSGYYNSTTTVADESTAVVTITSCSNNACSETAVTTGVTVVTETSAGVVTEYTTYCPLTGVSTSSAASTAASSADSASTISVVPTTSAASRSTDSTSTVVVASTVTEATTSSVVAVSTFAGAAATKGFTFVGAIIAAALLI